jgi:hypothetical protein
MFSGTMPSPNVDDGIGGSDLAVPPVIGLGVLT